MKAAHLLFVVLMLATANIAAQQTSSADDGLQAFKAKDWPKVVEIYNARTKNDPKDGAAWYLYGRGLEESGKTTEAIQAFQRAQELQYRPMFCEVRVAAIYAGMKDSEHALAVLEKLAADGLDAPKLLADEPRFAVLNNDARYKKVLDTVRLNGEPCKNPRNPEYRQFDFWVGDWDVFDKTGNKVGESSVKLILKDCVVYENWTSGFGGEGKSFNKYNPWAKQWEQYWVDEGVDRMFFTGHRVGEEMQFETEANMADGKPLHRKLTFYKLPDGSVRQFSRGSSDGGRTYSTEYDFVYKRKPETAHNQTDLRK
jgi:tetratricopeptide (TPR) repeat protein